ncbi:MAG: rhodanese-like domain-containing protein [Raineya sp.]|jgi:rhodanese-related sulfurtransferase|nr:rhodanese-like domain-containing protein [Raineya sp.]
MFEFFKKLFGKDEKLLEAITAGAFLVDVRTPLEFKSGSVKGAVNIPLDTISGQLHRFKNKNHIVVFCRSGMRSSQAKSVLEKNGFENVINGGSWGNVAALID